MRWTRSWCAGRRCRCRSRCRDGSTRPSACLRVQLARRFLNDVVRAARVVRRKKAVRYLRLAGHAAWPATVEFDDTPPETLAGGVPA